MEASLASQGILQSSLSTPSGPPAIFALYVGSSANLGSTFLNEFVCVRSNYPISHNLISIGPTVDRILYSASRSNMTYSVTGLLDWLDNLVNSGPNKLWCCPYDSSMDCRILIVSRKLFKT